MTEEELEGYFDKMEKDELIEFLEKMLSERDYQKTKWGDDFDSKNTPNDWMAYILSYAGKSVTLPWNSETFKSMLVKTATLCAAAYEWCERTNGEMPKRHYD